MANSNKKKKSGNSASPLPLAIVAVFGLAAGITIVVADHSPRAHKLTVAENSVAIEEEVVPMTSTTTTEVSATTTETTVTTTETQPLPEGSVTGIKLSFYETALRVGDAKVMPLVTMYPENATDKSEKWETSDPSVATVDGLGNITPVGAGKCTIKVTSVNNPSVFAEVSVSVVDPNANSSAKTKTTDTTTTTTTVSGTAAETTAANASANADIEVKDGITYIQGIMIVNKTYSLPATYNPAGMTPETAAAFTELQTAAKADGFTMNSVSDFRSYETQDTLYHNYVARDGQEAADRFSARAGHSEHQTGMAIDVNYAGDAFNETPEAKWLAENSWKYGFIIRYPQGKEDITGFKYESWHIRYLGKEWAKKIYDSGLTLEEYFKIDSKYAS